MTGELQRRHSGVFKPRRAAPGAHEPAHVDGISGLCNPDLHTSFFFFLTYVPFFKFYFFPSNFYKLILLIS